MSDEKKIDDHPQGSTASRAVIAFTAFAAVSLVTIMLQVGVSMRHAQSHRPVLHAVPVSELVLTEISPAKPEIFKELFDYNARAVYGLPTEPVAKAADVQVSIDIPARSATSPPPTPPPPVFSPPPPPMERPWLKAMETPPRPIDASMRVPEGSSGRWAYGVRDVRPGTILLANKPFNTSQGYYDRSAVLLLKACGCHPSIFGVILSPASRKNMSSAFCPIATKAYPSFLNSSIHLGGPVGPHFSILHASAEVPGALEVSPGLFLGGSLSRLQQLVSAGRADTSNVLFYAGYTAWPIDRLEKEVQAGQWKIAKAASSLVFDSAKRDVSARDLIVEAMLNTKDEVAK